MRYQPRCDICHERAGRIGLYEDHNHATSEARGRLCPRCNRGLGFYGESQERMAIAARLLTEGKVIKGEGYFWTPALLSRAAAYLSNPHTYGPWRAQVRYIGRENSTHALKSNLSRR